MLQKDHLLEWRSIYKNILLGLEIRKELTPEKLAHAEALLQTYGLGQVSVMPALPSFPAVCANVPL